MKTKIFATLLAVLSLAGIAFVTLAPLTVAHAASVDGPGCPPDPQ